MNRRQFLFSSAAFAAGGCHSICNFSHRYSVVILGDTHFDAEPASVYHSNYDEKIAWLNKVQREEFARNGEMWRERCPRLLRRAGSLIDDDTAFSLQTGDLIQGDCGRGEVHRKMLDDVMNAFKSELGGRKFVTVCGNHDIRGTDAEATYDAYMPGRMAEELGMPVDGVSFAFREGDDAWIVVDFNRLDADVIDRLLDDTEGARRTFFVTHGPVIPSGISGSPNWMCFGGASPDEIARREHFRWRLATRDAIVIAGHTHSLELAEWRGDGGRITQVIMNSVWAKDELAVPAVKEASPAEYAAGAKKENLALYDEYRAGLVRYYAARAAGCARLEVSDSGVSFDFHGGDSPTPTLVWQLGA